MTLTPQEPSPLPPARYGIVASSLDGTLAQRVDGAAGESVT
jgi:hypothetical protein